MHSQSIVIQAACSPDLAVLRAIMSHARASAGCFSKNSFTAEEFAARVEGEEIHVAMVDQRVVGFAAVWKPQRFIHHLYVIPQYQGRGVGAALLQQCEAVYGRPLALKCAVANARARRFYRKHGWVKTEQGIGEDGCWERLCLLDRQ